jgi:hypothetical protein
MLCSKPHNLESIGVILGEPVQNFKAIPSIGDMK